MRLANTKLTGFDLGSKLGSLSAFAGTAASSPDTSIQNASLNARVAPEGTKADKGGVAGGLTQVATLGSGKGGIPFVIEGTMSNPHFIPDMNGMAGGIAKGAMGDVLSGKNTLTSNPTNAISGLLGKKQK